MLKFRCSNFSVLRTICPVYYGAIFEPLVSKKFTSQTQNKSWKDELSKNPYFEKYSKKLDAIEKRAPGKIQECLNSNKSSSSSTKLNSEIKFNCSSFKRKDIQNKTSKTLWDIFNKEKVENMNCNDISHLWNEYHKKLDGLSAVLPTSIFSIIQQRGQKYPVFLLPLPRAGGYEFIVIEFSDDTFHYTTLLNYQTHKENSPECLNIKYFTELESKGIVLMRGEYDKNVISIIEAQFLANMAQIYYGENNTKKTELLEKFTKCSENFDHMELINEVETFQTGL